MGWALSEGLYKKLNSQITKKEEEEIDAYTYVHAETKYVYTFTCETLLAFLMNAHFK